MNGLSIVVGIIFLVCAFVGYRRGFIKIMASLAATVGTIILVMFLTPYVSDMLLKVIPIEQMVQEKCAEIFLPEEQTEAQEGSELSTDLSGNDLLAGAEDSQDAQISLIENAKMPDIFKQLLLKDNNEEIYKLLGVTKFSEYVGSYLAKQIANIASFLLILIVATIAIRIVLHTLGIIAKLPVIGGLNRVAGGIVGMGTGLVVVWVLFVVITLMYDTEIGKMCLAHITENQFLKSLYDNNILMNFIMKFRG